MFFSIILESGTALKFMISRKSELLVLKGSLRVAVKLNFAVKPASVVSSVSSWNAKLYGSTKY